MQRVLVTGSSGFIGSQVAIAFVAAGWDVRGLDRRPPAGRAHEFLVADLRDGASLDHALRGVDLVCHQAAKVGLGVDLQDLGAYVSDNDLATAELLAAMDRQDVGRLVFASSMVVYGEGAYTCTEHGSVSAPPREKADLELGVFDPRCGRCGEVLSPALVSEDARLDPRNVYAATKVAQEHLVAAWARARSGLAVGLRYHNVYGPGMPCDTPYAGVASLFRAAILRGEPPRVFEDGGQRRDFVHVRDVASANVAAAARDGAPGVLETYNVGSGDVRTVGGIAQTLAATMSGKPPLVTGEFRLGDVRHITASSAAARRDLEWSAKTSFEAGIAELASQPPSPGGQDR